MMWPLTTRLDLAGEGVVSLSANHLQKLRLSFQLTSPHGNAFKPHQVGIPICLFMNLPFSPHSDYKLFRLQAFLKLTHESNVEHIFVVGNSGKKFEILLVKFLGSNAIFSSTSYLKTNDCVPHNALQGFEIYATVIIGKKIDMTSGTLLGLYYCFELERPT